jgi:exodeoxyribonuclease V beta subunit
MATLDEAEIRADLEALAARSGGAIRVRDASPTAAAGPLAPAATPAPLRAAELAGRIDGSWRLVSYSGLVSGRDSELPDYDAAAAPQPDEPPSGPIDPAFQFPRGVAAGHCLHGLLEQVDFPAVDRGSLEATARGMLERFGLERRWSPVAADLVLNALETPLDADGTLRLRDVPRSNRLSELEFHYPLARLEAADLHGRLSDFAGYRRAGQGLNFQAAEGLMHGFIDLVFRHRGRYFLADYKSNHLGDRLTDYGAPGLTRAMDAHRYDLQYLVYAVALHRYLRRRLAGYDYDAHLGGAYYLFVRGMRPAEGPRFGVFFDRPERAVVEALDRLFAGAPGQ